MLGWSLALSPELAPLCHCRAAHGLLAQLAENLFLQWGLRDILQVGCGEGQGCLSPSCPLGPSALINLTLAASMPVTAPCPPPGARPALTPWLGSAHSPGLH